MKALSVTGRCDRVGLGLGQGAVGYQRAKEGAGLVRGEVWRGAGLRLRIGLRIGFLVWLSFLLVRGSLVRLSRLLSLSRPLGLQVRGGLRLRRASRGFIRRGLRGGPLRGRRGGRFNGGVRRRGDYVLVGQLLVALNFSQGGDYCSEFTGVEDALLDE